MTLVPSNPFQLAVIATLFTTVNVACTPETVKPGFDSAVEPYSENDRKILNYAGKATAELADKGMLYRDATVQNYIDFVGNKVTASLADKQEFQFHILRDSVVNAFAFPNGHIYISIGLLARLENEAQLAFILGHEAAHVSQLHAMEAAKDRKTKRVAAHITDILLFGTSIAYLPFGAAMYSYNRGQESESDVIGFQLMTEAGYDPQAVLGIFHTIEEVREAETVSGSIYASHPSNQARERRLQALLDKRTRSNTNATEEETDSYRSMRTKLVHKNIELKLRARQYHLALEAAEQAAQEQIQDPWLLYYRAEARRNIAADPVNAAKELSWLEGKNESVSFETQIQAQKLEYYQQAQEDFLSALNLDPELHLCHRGIGLIAHARGETDAAQAALERYLASPNPKRDRRYIHHLLKELSN